MIWREKVGVPGCVILLQFRLRRLGRETTFWTPGQPCAARRKGIRKETGKVYGRSEREEDREEKARDRKETKKGGWRIQAKLFE